MILDNHAVVPIAGVTSVVVFALFAALTQRAGHVRQYGRRRCRQRSRLVAELDRWSPTVVEGVVNWHDYPALTKRDIRELLYERGWYYQGQDIHGARWPLYATRDARLAESADAPPSREELLRTELGEAIRSGGDDYLLDLVPYLDLPRGTVGEMTGRAGFRTAPPHKLIFPMTVRLVRTGVRGSGEDTGPVSAPAPPDRPVVGPPSADRGQDPSAGRRRGCRG